MSKHFTIRWSSGLGTNSEAQLVAPVVMREIDFQRLCQDLVPEAGKRAMEKCRGQMYPVGWVEIIEALCDILVEQHGFERFLPKSVTFKGSWTITDRYPPEKDDALLGEVHKELAHFNDTTLWDCVQQAVS